MVEYSGRYGTCWERRDDGAADALVQPADRKRRPGARAGGVSLEVVTALEARLDGVEREHDEVYREGGDGAGLGGILADVMIYGVRGLGSTVRGGWLRPRGGWSGVTYHPDLGVGVVAHPVICPSMSGEIRKRLSNCLSGRV